MLAVVGAVIGTIWVAAAKFYEDYKVNKTVNDVALIVKNLQGLISIRDSEEMSMQGLTDLTPHTNSCWCLSKRLGEWEYNKKPVWWDIIRKKLY